MRKRTTQLIILIILLLILFYFLLNVYYFRNPFLGNKINKIALFISASLLIAWVAFEKNKKTKS